VTRAIAGSMIWMVVMGTTACTSKPDPTPTSSRSSAMSTENGKQGTGEVHHDLAPLTSRFSALGTPDSATWLSGELSGSAPGPTTYWIDAVVTVSPAVAATLLATAPQPTTTAPDVIAALAPSLPAAPLSTGTDLDALFAAGQFRATAYLTPDGRTVVLVAKGQ
jgi:hypothetical protein